MSDSPAQEVAAERVATLAAGWADALASWAIPDAILAQAPQSPWIHPVTQFAARADHALHSPGGCSYDRAVEALVEPGTVLDVGAGAGAASLPLASRATGLTAVDSEPDMLAAYAERAAALGVRPSLVEGEWPDVADRVGRHDLVLVHHVLYNVAEVVPFLEALTTAARRRVVVELPPGHPLSWMSPLWQRFWDLDRPTSPTADDLAELLRALGVEGLTVDRWTRDDEVHDARERAEWTTRRLCLPPERVVEVEAAMVELGLAADDRRALVTVAWQGAG